MFNLLAARNGPGQESHGRMAKGSHKLGTQRAKPAAEGDEWGQAKAVPLPWTPSAALPCQALESLLS